MQLLYLADIFAVASSEAYNPAPPSPCGFGDWKPLVCKAVTRAATQAGQQACATNFCSSYLAIPRRTTARVVNQRSTTTITPPPSTSTVSARPVTITLPSSSTSTSIVVTTITNPTTTVTTTSVVAATITLSSCLAPTAVSSTTATTSTTTAGPARKRQVRKAVPKPDSFKPYPAGAALSSACRCFDIVPSTTTTTRTSIITTTSTASARTVSVTTTSTITVNTLSVVTSVSTSTTLATSTTVTTTTGTLYVRPTTAVRILAGGSGTDYDGRYLASNTTSPYNRITNILTEFVTQDSLEDRRARETLFFISEDDQLMRTLGYSGDSLKPASGYLGGSPADILADPNKKKLYVEFEDTKNQAELDDKNEAFVQCTMSTDPATGACPVSCNILGAFDTTRPAPSSSYQGLRYWALYRANDPDKPAIALYGVTPPASG